VKLEREIDRLHAVVDAGTKQRITLHRNPGAFWAEADFQQRRDLVRLMIERVEVIAGRRALRRYDASRVRIPIPTLQPRKLVVSVATTETCRSALVSVSARERQRPATGDRAVGAPHAGGRRRDGVAEAASVPAGA
jgi:hypothetical protein